MENPTLDKIIGCSAITPNTLAVHKATGAIAIAAQGCVSIIIPTSGQRFDVKVSDRCHEITALAFSNEGNYLAVGEAGPDARISVLAFSGSFDRVTSRIEIVTKENGFSALALNAKTGVLVSIGTDTNPMFILWDITQPVAVAIGYYKLPRVPNKVVLTADCSMAIVAGKSLLKFVQAQVERSPKPALLKTRVANIQQYVISNFVDVCCSASMPATVYAVTEDGVLCYFENVASLFQSRKGPPLVLTPIRLKRGEMTGLAFDDKSVFCASVNGNLIQVTKDGSRHRVSGRYSAIEGKIVGVGVGDDVIVAAFDDGHIVCWQTSQPGSPAFFVLSQHRGPVCGMSISKDESLLVTCGSDETVRLWEIHRGEKLISKSSQEEKAEKRFNIPDPGYFENLTGVRCGTYVNDLIAVGRDNGCLHLLDGDLNELHSVQCRNGSVMCIATQSDGIVACGYESGNVSLYEVSDNRLIHKTDIAIGRTPVKSIAICHGTLAAASNFEITFVKLSDGSQMHVHKSTEPVLELNKIDRAGIICAVGCDHCLTLFTAEQGKLFRKHQLSLNNFPLAIAVHKSGLLIATAMSNGNVFLIDPMSGNSVCGFPALTEMITSVMFQGEDLIVSTFGGAVMIWKLPSDIRKELEGRPTSAAPPAILSLLKPNSDESDDKEIDNHILNAITCSMMSGRKSMANWTFREDQDAVEPQDPVVNDGEKEENTDPDQPGDIDDERQPAPDTEKKVMDFVRNSMLGSKKGNWFANLMEQEKHGAEEEELIELRLPPDRPKRKIPGIDKLVADAEEAKPVMPKIKPIEMDVYDSIFDDDEGGQSPSPARTRESPIAQQEPGLADRIKSTTLQLREILAVVETFKSKKFESEAEKQAQAKIQSLMESLDTEKRKRDAKCQMINEYVNRLRASALETENQVAQAKKLIDDLKCLS